MNRLMPPTTAARRNQSVRLFSEAVQHQKRGLNELAWVTCEKIIQSDPHFVDAHMMQGVILAQRQSYAAAAECFGRIVSIEPKHIPARFNQGLMLSQAGLWAQAEEVFRAVCSLDQAHVPCLNSLGVVCAQQGKFVEAQGCFEAALRFDERQPDAWNNLANCQMELGQLAKAEACLHRALALYPQHADAMFNLAKLFVRLDRSEEAAQQYQALLALHPQHHPARINLSKLWVDEGKSRKAIESLLETQAQASENPELSFSLGVAYKESEQYALAIPWFDRAIALHADYHSAYVNRAACWRELGQLDAAFADMDRAKEKGDPETQSIWWSLYATLYEDSDQNEKVEAAFQRAMDLDAGNIKPFLNYGMWLLKQQRFAQAWPYYQYRHRIKASRPVQWLDGLPIWQEGDLKGRVLILGEQGVGDQVLHSKWLRLYVARHGAPACVTVDDRLLAAMRRSLPSVRFLPQSQRPSLQAADFDVQLGLADLAALMSIDPRVDDWVAQPSLRAATVGPHLPRRTDRPLVGISWKSANAKNSADKSLALLEMMTQLKAWDVEWVNLQYGDVSAEIEQVNQALGLQILQAPELDIFNDLEGLMALIQSCDGVISTSNSTAHFCGALGQKGMVMVPYNKGKLWYWHTEDGPSPWYPSLHIVHGQRQNDWSHALTQVQQSFMSQLGGAA